MSPYAATDEISGEIDFAHHLYLLAFLLEIILVDAYGVHPNRVIRMMQNMLTQRIVCVLPNADLDSIDDNLRKYGGIAPSV